MSMQLGQSQDHGEQRTPSRLVLLAEASAWLTLPLELEALLERVARLPIPALADGCVVQLLGRGVASAPEHERPHFDQLTIAHVDDATTRRLRALYEESTAFHHAQGALEALRSGELQVVEDLAGEPASSLMHELNATSYVAVPLRARGQLLGVLSVVHCTPRRGLERELIGELAQLASGAIDNVRLYQEAQRAIAVRDDVLAVVSHDLQSPLNAIGMTVKGLLADPQLSASSHVKRALALIERTSKHIGQLCGELTEVGSIQAGRLAIAPRPTAIDALLHEALAILEPLRVDKRQRVVTQLEPGLPSAHCDGAQIVRVLMNLIGNAIKFTGEGGELTIAARRLGGQIEVAIRDTGPGIAAEDLPKLFEPYWRSRHAGRRGMGLGLYIARGIIEAHGGPIWAESQLGVGSSFVFRLAIAPAEAT